MQPIQDIDEFDGDQSLQRNGAAACYLAYRDRWLSLDC
jgi:hypothetical protein